MPAEEYKEVDLHRLRLDTKNPRLPREVNGAPPSQDSLLREFYRRYNLIELARSIADKGFGPRHAEALLVVEDRPDSGHFEVIEGNRRLATLKLLENADSRRAVGIGNKESEWKNLVAKASSQGLGNVPVIVYPDREDVDDYLGFRHITGPKPWRPEAKARFIAKLLDNGDAVSEVARSIGSNHRTVRRYAEAHQIYKQALEAGFAMDTVEAAFGVFYNALDQKGIREFLDLGQQTDINELPETPVKPEHMDSLRDLIGFLYGDSEQNLDAVIRESRELRKLGEVLANELARANLLRDRNLERAWRVGGGGRMETLALLADTHSKLAEVTGKSGEFGEDKEIQEEVHRMYLLVMEMAIRYRVAEN